MLIGISSIEKSLDSKIDTRFGRSKYFIIYDTNSKKFTVLDNEVNLSVAQGAGIQTAQNLVNQNIEVLLTNNCGPKAFKVLSISNVKIYITGTNSTVSEAINEFNSNKLNLMKDPNVEAHWE